MVKLHLIKEWTYSSDQVIRVVQLVSLHLIKELCLIKGPRQLIRVVRLVKLHFITDTKSRG